MGSTNTQRKAVRQSKNVSHKKQKKMPTPKISNHYRYTITDQIGSYFSEPLNESQFSIEWELQKDAGKRTYSKKLSGNVTFRGTPYDRLLQFETSIYRCVPQKLLIERRCNTPGLNVLWTPMLSGIISLNNGDWDLDACQVTFKIDEDSTYKCFNDNKGTKLNLLGAVPSRYSVKLFSDNVVLEEQYYEENETVTGSDDYLWLGAGDPYDQEYQPYNHHSELSGNLYSRHTSWVRQILTVACTSPEPAGDWTLVADTCSTGGDRKYARKASLYDCVTTKTGDSIAYSIDYVCQVLGSAGQALIIDNGMKLKDIVIAFVDAFCPGLTVQSLFFDFAATGDPNYVTGSASKVNNIFVYQKSDVKRPTSTGNSSIAQWTFEKFMTQLNFMFNVEWRIEDGIFKIEHVSFWPKSIGADLTQSRYKREMIGKRKYTYSTEKIPKHEIWKFKEFRYYSDFEGTPITYSGCVTADGTDQDVTYAIDDVTTDVQLCLENPDSKSSIVSDEGFVFIAAASDGTNYYIITENAILGPGRLNNSLGVSQLLRDYHKYNRPLSVGIMNGATTTFLSTIPTKKGESIYIPFCCGDTFEPDNYILTFLGAGSVDKATFDFNEGTLKLDLLYQADSNLTPNSPPVANNDVFNMYVDTVGTIDVIANDTDVDEGDYISKIEIMGNPTHGNAYVSNNKIIYIPAATYTGNDIMLYRIFDRWGAVSNNAIITINVRPLNSPPDAVNDFYTVYIESMPVTIPAPGVFANDSDDNSFSLLSFTNPTSQGGTVTVNSDGSFTYNRPSGFTGTDTFTYTIQDDASLTDTATVTLNVTSNQTPVAVNDSFNTTKNTSLAASSTRNLLSNDYTPAAGTYTYTCTGETKATTGGGTVTIQTNGQFSYTPASNYTGADTFTYTMSNGIGSASATVTINVIPTLYIRLQNSDPKTSDVIGSCGTGSTILGYRDTKDFTIYFYSDSGGTIAYDVTGLSLQVNVKTAITDNISGPSNPTTSFTVSGTSYKIFNDKIVYQEDQDCAGDNSHFYTATVSLLPGNYITL
jgi:hypothetical protein